MHCNNLGVDLRVSPSDSWQIVSMLFKLQLSSGHQCRLKGKRNTMRKQPFENFAPLIPLSGLACNLQFSFLVNWRYPVFPSSYNFVLGISIHEHWCKYLPQRLHPHGWAGKKYDPACKKPIITQQPRQKHMLWCKRYIQHQIVINIKFLYNFLLFKVYMQLINPRLIKVKYKFNHQNSVENMKRKPHNLPH